MSEPTIIIPLSVAEKIAEMFPTGNCLDIDHAQASVLFLKAIVAAMKEQKPNKPDDGDVVMSR